MHAGSVQELLQKAEDDAHAADVLMREGGVATWVIGFHLQQAAEKLLKAAIIAAGRNPAKNP